MKKKVAIVVPIYKENLTEGEILSLKHLDHFLGKFDKFCVAPRNLNAVFPGYKKVNFSPKYFESTRTYNKLLLSSKFYKKFLEYEFILIYQLDALVFSDTLLDWCEAGYDYIGAPWMISSHLPWLNEVIVGNGGFSLRRVDAFSKVLTSKNLWIDPTKYWANICQQYNSLNKHKRLPKRLLLRSRFYNGIKTHIKAFLKKRRNEDYFFSIFGVHYYPKFRVAPIHAALGFSFEVEPRTCFEENNFQIPFGCHAWEKYDRAFWEPYLLKG